MRTGSGFIGLSGSGFIGFRGLGFGLPSAALADQDYPPPRPDLGDVYSCPFKMIKMTRHLARPPPDEDDQDKRHLARPDVY